MVTKDCKLYTETGEPKRIRCYMYKKNPPFSDHITVVFTHTKELGYPANIVVFRTMNELPCHPAIGIGLWGEANRRDFYPGGSRVKFSELPEDCQKVVREDYKELWEGRCK